MASRSELSPGYDTSMFDTQDDGAHSDDDPNAPPVDADSQMEAIEAAILSSLQVANSSEKPKRLTMQLIRQSIGMAIKHSGTKQLLALDDEEPQHQDDDEAQEIDALLQKKVLRLDWMSLGKIENLDAFTHIQELYLQHNLIRTVENLDDHHELSFLALGGNRITKVENLRHLTKLKFLDLSHNAIDDFDIREFPPSLVVLRLAGNPFTRHMPAYMHLFFERLPNLTQIDHFRRVPIHLVDAGTATSPRATSPLSYSPRSQFVELEMEVELSHASHKPVSDNTATEGHPTPVSFDFSDYDKHKHERMAKWKQQLKDLETRKAEIEGEIPMITRTSSMSSLRSRRKLAVAKAQEATQTAITDSIAHFQQMEAEHKEWQDRQQKAA